MAINTRTWLATVALLALTACQPNKGRQQPATDAQQPAAAAEKPQKAPIISFTMTDMDGNNVAVTDEFAKHKITIIDFWASWCGPCMHEMPSLVSTYAEYKDKGLGIVGVSLDEDKDSWKEAVDKMGMTWTQLSDLQGWNNAAAQMYGIQSIPFTIVVDGKGEVITAGLRGEDLKAFVASRLDTADTAAK